MIIFPFMLFGFAVNDTRPYTDSQMLESFPPDSDEQQACITSIKDADGYNWG